MFRKLTTAAIAGAMLLSSTGIAFADEGALAAGEPATVKQAADEGISDTDLALGLGAAATIIVIVSAGSGSSTVRTH